MHPFHWLPRRFPTLLVALVVVIFAAFGGLAGLALAQEDKISTPAQAEAFVPPPMAASVQTALQQSSDPAQKCAGCHMDIYETWNKSPHHQTYSNANFQKMWDAQAKDPQCLQCHTTNFRPSTGTYETEGVSCTACHGEIPADHPKTPVNLDIANTVCKDCHTVTFAEFRASMHEAKGLKCTSCHYAHENGLRLGDQVSQCTNCHATQLDDFAHESHVNAGLKCRNCHGYVDPNQTLPVDGLAPTGHDFRESVRACLDCHKDFKLTTNGNEQGFSPSETAQSSITGEKAALRITQLENAYKTVVLQNRNANQIGMLQGALGGLVVGGVVAGVLVRRRRMSDDQGGPDDH